MAPSRKRGGGKAAASARREWKVGDLVLAKVKGFPAWPAAVCASLFLPFPSLLILFCYGLLLMIFIDAVRQVWLELGVWLLSTAFNYDEVDVYAFLLLTAFYMNFWWGIILVSSRYHSFIYHFLQLIHAPNLITWQLILSFIWSIIHRLLVVCQFLVCLLQVCEPDKWGYSADKKKVFVLFFGTQQMWVFLPFTTYIV